jgi:hypothetical protein
MANTILKYVNQRGIPCIESQSVSLTTSAETFTFNAHPYVRYPFQGQLFIRITGTNTAPETAVPIQFTTSGVSDSTVPVYNAQGTALTTATFPGDGIYIGFYDSTTGLLRLLNA